MSKTCDLCAKGYQKANLVPRGIGNRVTNRALTRNRVNLRSKRFDLGGNSVRLRICTSCLKRIKKDGKAAEERASSK